MLTVVETLNVIANAKCEINLDSFNYTKISKSTEQVGQISSADRIKLATDIANAKNAVEVQYITDKASKIAYEKSHLKFVWDSNYSVISNINYNETRPNLSLSFVIKGKIHLPSDSPNNLPKDFETFVFRNFNVIHDGILNIYSFVAKLDNATADYLRSNGVTIHDKGNDEYFIDLASTQIIPLNTSRYNAIDIVDDVYQIMKRKSFIKVAKAFLDKVNPINKSTGLINKYGDESSEYLRNLGITDNGFNPKSTEKPSTSSYFVNELILKFQGMSNMPSFNAFIKKINENKKLNNADMLMKAAYDTCVSNEATMSNADFINWLIVEISKAERENKEYAKRLFIIKFEVLRCNKWFDDLNASNSNIVDYKGIAVEVVKKSTEIEI